MQIQMDKERLYELLDIDSGEDFMYFDNFAGLVECDEEIDTELIYEILQDVDPGVFIEICNEFFEDAETSIPEEEAEVYALLLTIRRALIGMSKIDDEEVEHGLLILAEELNKFRRWYSCESRVECRNQETNQVREVPLRDALALSRMEKLSDESYFYDFTDALNYDVEEYVMNFAELEDEL